MDVHPSVQWAVLRKPSEGRWVWGGEGRLRRGTVHPAEFLGDGSNPSAEYHAALTHHGMPASLLESVHSITVTTV